MAQVKQKNLEEAKAAVGRAAAELVEEGMVIGLGTGTTARYLIDALAERCRQGLTIQGVATSEASLARAIAHGIPMLDIDEAGQIDLDFDGADEIDPEKRMIKGGGGALLREKMVATFASEMVVLIDESKRVGKLGRAPLPIEVVPFGHFHLEERLREMGYEPTLRRTDQGDPYTTDNGNYILDLKLAQPLEDPEFHHLRLRTLPGVVETGLFLNLAGRVLIGHADGTVTVWE
ncbi:MAG: ribose-5-phosphate isomerase RpiA [Parachlamydiales bacterium]